ncbi:MAG TPA: class IV adenylate cyclase [Mycobacteriales bacterium]|nr:class IV adenylate cyclase [Mycobacteriales bacterium]
MRSAFCQRGVAAVEVVRAGLPAVFEVEVKYRIADPVVLTVALERRGIALGQPVQQDDQAYAEARWVFGMPKVGYAFARLRTEADRHLFTIKRPQANELACVAHETEAEAADRQGMHNALLAMGYYPTVRIVKSRRTAHVGDASLFVDDVVGLGPFPGAGTDGVRPPVGHGHPGGAGRVRD